MSYEEEIAWGVQQMLDADLQFPQDVPDTNVVKNNADHIRSMTDEELAKFIADKIPHGDCYGCPWFYDCFCDSDSCSKNFLDWLKQPYKEAEDG